MFRRRRGTDMQEIEYIEMPQPLGIFAGDLYDRGIGYLSAFEVLSRENNQTLLYASYFLFAHSLELLLKSFLAARGTTKKAIRDFGHNLPEIFRACVQQSIPKVADLEPYVHHTFEMNRDFDFRYPSGYNLSMPSPKECVPIARALANTIEPIINRTRIDANLQFASDTRQFRGKKVRWSD
ncbi:MAG TPA: hypothetical protein VMH84_18195 [Xanthobacteraceae bacterium]|nr:hypothetical protein [Xanthobacteraceae bacterium]